MEKQEPINIDSLRYIAIYLEGLKDGKGNLLPLGIFDLNELWRTINKLDDEREK